MELTSRFFHPHIGSFLPLWAAGNGEDVVDAAVFSLSTSSRLNLHADQRDDVGIRLIPNAAFSGPD